MGGTNQSSAGFRRITRLGPLVKIRLFGFLAVVAGGSTLLCWIAQSAWQQLDRLQKEHAAVKGESFYLGVGLRGSIRGLNEKLMQFGHSLDPVVRNDFFREATGLHRWLTTNRVELAELSKLPLLKQITIDDFDILDKIDKEYARYLGQATNLLALTNASPISFEDRYHQVRQASSDLLGLCDDLVQAQRQDFADFLGETQGTLVAHQRLLKLTLTLIVALAGTLALLVYRGLIAPLRVGLNQSKTIIERQEKLASLGVLASGVAHEVRNPLTAVKFRLFSLKRGFPALAENEDAAVIGTEINRLEQIVKDFLLFARPSEPELAAIPAGRILKEVHGLMKGPLERSAIQLKFEEADGAWVHADARQLQQVLINLVRNAAEAIGRNGTIGLRVRQAAAEFGRRAKPAVILVVSDTGQGISPEVQARLFDPFFTTKESGTGLGLAISARIVEKHGGVLQYYTELGYGTTFEVVLPAVETHANAHTPD